MVLWALDIEDGWPTRAHEVSDDGTGRVTACGQRLTETNHLRGWWTLPAGEDPLVGPQTVHCRRVEENGEPPAGSGAWSPADVPGEAARPHRGEALTACPVAGPTLGAIAGVYTPDSHPLATFGEPW